MMYSVWNPGARAYDYYESAAPPPIHAPSATHVATVSKLGATAESAAWRLPMAARRVGSGAVARGQVATSSPASGLGDVDLSSPATLAAAGVAAYVLWKVLR